MRKYRLNLKLKAENKKRTGRGWGPLTLDEFMERNEPVSVTNSIVPTISTPERVRRSERANISDASATSLDSNSESSKLIVKMQFRDKILIKNKTKLRNERRRSEKLQRQVWKLKKMLTATNRNRSETNEVRPASSETTAGLSGVGPSTARLQLLSPLDKAEQILRSDGISPTKASSSFQALAVSEAVLDAIGNTTPRRKKVLSNVILNDEDIKSNRMKSKCCRRLDVKRRFRKSNSNLRNMNRALFEMEKRKILKFFTAPIV